MLCPRSSSNTGAKKQTYFKGSKKEKKAKKRKRREEANIEEIAREAVLFNCDCGKMCLASVGATITESSDMMASYITPWVNMSKKEHRNKFFSILEGCVTGQTEGGHLEKRCVFFTSY
jgi:hypothetical protein